MSALEALRPKLDEMEPDEIRAPDQPTEVYFQETTDVLTHIAEHQLAGMLVDEGLEQETLDAVPQALAAAQEAQSLWAMAYEKEKPVDQKTAEEKGFALRTKVAKKARFALRKNKAGLAVLSQILEGEGIADLVQDLDDLGMLLKHYSAAFARNRNFDAVATTTELTALATTIRSGLAGFRMSTAQSKAVDLRNRAWSFLDDLLGDVREAGRAATEGKIARGFGSAHERRLRAAQRRKAKAGSGGETS